MKSTNSENTAHQTVDRMASSAHDTVDKFAEVSNDATDNLEEKGQQLKEIQELWVANVRKYVRANPGTSLGIAIAGGFLASHILSSR